MTISQASPTSPASSDTATYTLVIETTGDGRSAETLSQLLAVLKDPRQPSPLPGFALIDFALGNVVQAHYTPEIPS